MLLQLLFFLVVFGVVNRKRGSFTDGAGGGGAGAAPPSTRVFSTLLRARYKSMPIEPNEESRRHRPLRIYGRGTAMTDGP